jgi:hypothetical protein
MVLALVNAHAMLPVRPRSVDREVLVRATVLACVLVASSVTVPTAAAASAGPTPPTTPVTVDVLNVNGSGCRQGTVAVAVSPDKTAFTVTYSGYLAQVGGGAKKNDAGRDCRLNLRVNTAAGYSPAIAQVDYRGYGELAAGASATFGASYRFHGSDRSVAPTRTFTGPYADNWQVTDGGVAGLVYGPCGKSRNVDVDSRLTVLAGTSDPASTFSYIAMDSADGVAVTTYHLAWRRCS